MKIAIFGGSGFIGKHLISHFQKKGDEVFLVTRKPPIKSNDSKIPYIQWLNEKAKPERELDGCDVFINLAGKSIDSKWSPENKKAILNSRLKATEEVLRIIENVQNKPKLLINASAVGIYGTSFDQVFTEDSTLLGNDFLARTVKEWESRAKKAIDLGVRVVYARFGVVLDQKEGALPKMALPYQLFAGGTVGSGKQWLSWIHIEDVVRLISFMIEHERITGAVNVVAPNPVRMKEFGQTLANVMKRPHWLPAPSLALKRLLGEKSILVLEGQKVLPDKALQHGFIFTYPTIEKALSAIYSRA